MVSREGVEEEAVGKVGELGRRGARTAVELTIAGQDEAKTRRKAVEELPAPMEDRYSK